MPSKLKNLNSIFDSIILRIPDYQRGYSWDKKHLTDLWNDLKNINKQTFHFTGILTFEKVNQKTKEKWTKEFDVSPESNLIFIGNKAYTPYFIVDGQQRLVSIIILISLLKSALGNLTEAEKIDTENKYISITEDGRVQYLFGYEKDTPSHQYLIGKIFDDQTMKVTEPETIYTLNLERSKSFFLEQLLLLDETKKKSLFYKLTNNLLFNVFEIESEKVDMSLVFETLNYRGKQLSKLELFKNRLIFLITKRHTFEIAYKIRGKVIQTWQDIYEWLGKSPKNRLNDDDFLRAFWIMFYIHDDDRDDDFKKFEQDIFDNKYRITEIHENEFITEYNINRLLLSLSISIKYWFFIHNPKTELTNFEYCTNVRLLLEKLLRNTYGEFMKPLILAYFQKSNAINELEELLQKIERHNFCVYLLAGKQADTNRPQFYRIINQYLRPQGLFAHSLVISMLKEKTEDHLNFDNIFNHIHRNRANNKKFYDCSRGIMAKYCLWEWEENLRANRNHLISDYTKAETDLIFPDEGVRVRLDQTYSGVRRQRNIENINKLCYSLGNMTITQNARLPNNYSTLRQKMHNGSHTDREIAANYSVWTDQAILARGLSILSFIEAKWGVSIGDDSQKKRLLLDGVQV